MVADEVSGSPDEILHLAASAARRLAVRPDRGRIARVFRRLLWDRRLRPDPRRELRRLVAWSSPLSAAGVITAADGDRFESMLDELFAAKAAAVPDIAVFTDNPAIFNRAWWHNRAAYEALLGRTTVCMTDNIVYFSQTRPAPEAPPGFIDGSIVAVQHQGRLSFLANAFYAASARTASTIALLRSLLPEVRAAMDSDADRFMVVVQHGDHIVHPARSVAYGKRRGSAEAVRLIPDPAFFDSLGYRELREAAALDRLPRWEDRRDVVFWRGSATNRGRSPGGEAAEALEQVPRVAMCLALRGRPNSDAAISAPWGPQFAHDEVRQRLADAGIFRPAVPMLEHAAFRYLIDIDGVVNAWSLFEKLLLGSCILKIGSPFEQWFYGQIAPWRHFVPVREDLYDLTERLEWCRAHEEEARRIAAAGQQFALGHTYEVGRRLAAQAIRDCLVSF